MIDFSAYKGWAIPEGNVVEVTDEAGNVLWSAAQPVTISYSLGNPAASATYYNHIVHNGIEYTGSGSLIANIGNIVLVRCSPGGQYSAAAIFLNGELNQVASASGRYAEYNYEVVSDATIAKDTGSAQQYRGAIYITDANA